MNGEGPVLNEAMESPMTFRRFYEEEGAPYGRRVPRARRCERGGGTRRPPRQCASPVKIARLFSNEEEFNKYLELRDAELGYYRKMSVKELAPILEANEVNQVVLNRGSDGWWGRFYL